MFHRLTSRSEGRTNEEQIDVHTYINGVGQGVRPAGINAFDVRHSPYVTRRQTLKFDHTFSLAAAISAKS